MNKNELFKDGYLDLEINEYIKGFRKKYEIEYLCIKKFDKIIRKLQNELMKKSALQQNTFIIASLTELQKLYDSAVLLFERGIPEPANVLIRTILDLSFKIIEVVRNKQFVNDLILEAYYEKLAMLNDIDNHKLYDMISKEKVRKIKDEVETKINQKQKPNTKTYFLANKNKLYREYLLYRFHCEYAHQSTSIIGSIIKQTEEGIYIDGDLQLDDFKISAVWLLSIVFIPVNIIINEYIKNENLIEEFNEFFELIENSFKNIKIKGEN